MGCTSSKAVYPVQQYGVVKLSNPLDQLNAPNYRIPKRDQPLTPGFYPTKDFVFDPKKLN